MPTAAPTKGMLISVRVHAEYDWPDHAFAKEGSLRMASTSTATVLNGWKEIGRYLGRGVRTVQRYERSHNLPVRRLEGRPSGAVIASPKDLDAWLKRWSVSEAYLPHVQQQGRRFGLGGNGSRIVHE